MQLVYYPDQRLRKVCVEAPIQPEIERARIAGKMWKIMKKRRGVGLAAPQVGLNIRMFVFLQDGCNQAIWNPVLSCVRGVSEATEGCLSLPKVNITIQRSTSSVLKGQGVNGRHLHYIGSPTMTRIWQHETDHLNGKLIIDEMGEEEAFYNEDALEMLLNTTGT